jgi:hypothetical protein
MTRPLIQVEDEVREMTDEELAIYEAIIADHKPLPDPE